MKRIIVLFLLFAAVPAWAQGGVAVPKTIKEFIKMSPSDTTLCQVRGIVSRIGSTTSGNLHINDGTGELYIYGIVIPDRPGASVRQLDIKVGDTLTFNGRRAVYKGTVEMVSARLVAKADGPDHDAPLKLDREPSFKGKSGKAAREAFAEWVAARVRYPDGAAGAEGTVVVRYVIGRNGGVQEVQVEKGVHPALNAEAVRIVSSSPKWKPALLNGSPLRLTYTVKVPFTAPSTQ